MAFEPFPRSSDTPHFTASSTFLKRSESSHYYDSSKNTAETYSHYQQIHTDGLAGPDYEIIPTSRFRPANKRKINDTKINKSYTFVLRRTWKLQGGVSFLIRVELEIQSEALCQALRTIIKNTYERTDLEVFPIRISGPFVELFFYRHEIEALATDPNVDEYLRQDAAVLKDFVQTKKLMRSIWQDHDRFTPKGQVVGYIIWTIYPPNSLLVLDVGPLHECWICRDVVFIQSQNQLIWRISGLRLDSNGNTVGLARQTVELPMIGMHLFKIVDLPVVPIKYYRDWKGLEVTLRSSHGPNILSDIEEKNTQESTTPDLNSVTGLQQMMLDAFTIDQGNFALLFPALVPSFDLKEKTWEWVLSDKLEPLNPMTKTLVQTLVKGHRTGKAVFDDVIQGKGQGLIFLLHGDPGLGKTPMAESVADHLRRPLYSISGGELGTEVSKVEKRLDRTFDLAKIWDAVSLLDEADVIFFKRSSAEIDRNAIVAVFLRKIEYFQGVLFLTTNRKQDFDHAFKSRIHLTLSFPRLRPEFQSFIWQRLVETNTQGAAHSS
ncbi:hypothetical protein N7488_002991 [Penicillium malachiteum]|nr:hypothetical protein N7488_002991 [Penicillium malachiteum]